MGILVIHHFKKRQCQGDRKVFTVKKYTTSHLSSHKQFKLSSVKLGWSWKSWWTVLIHYAPHLYLFLFLSISTCCYINIFKSNCTDTIPVTHSTQYNTCNNVYLIVWQQDGEALCHSVIIMMTSIINKKWHFYLTQRRPLLNTHNWDFNTVIHHTFKVIWLVLS